VTGTTTRSEATTDTGTSSRPVHRRLARPALGLVAGLLVAFSMPPWGFWPLTFVGIVLFELALGAEPTRRQRLAVGFAFGVGWMYLGMAWMFQLSLPGYLVAAAVFSGYHAVAALVAPLGVWRAVSRPLAHTLAEALRFSFPFGGVPLATIGMAQVGGPFVGVVRVAGVLALTWFAFQLGHALAVALPTIGGRLRSRPQLDRGAASGLARHAVVAVVICVVLFGASFVAPRGHDTGETLQVAAVQGGGRQGTSALEVPSSEVTERHLEATGSIEADPALDLVVWPENTIDVDTFEGSWQHEAVTAEAARLDVPIAVGITEELRNGTRRTNAQVVVMPDGEIADRYDKVRRVPFGEYVPLRGLLEMIGAPIDQIGRDAVAGTEPAYLDLPDGPRLAVVISWEVFFAGRAREGVREGGEAILNPTNGASYTGTIVQTQQVASSRLRALETGRWVVQAAPTGFTAIVDANGTVLQRTAVSEQRILYADVPMRSGFTWYTRLGDRPVIIVLALALGTVLVIARRHRHASGSQ
jgi:apolipoprotein N-acyltransferase